MKGAIAELFGVIIKFDGAMYYQQSDGKFVCVGGKKDEV